MMQILKNIGLTLVMCLSMLAQAQDQIVLMVGYAPGSITDRLARAVQRHLTEDLIPTTVEYKLGAGGEIAVRTVAGNLNKQPMLLLSGTNLVMHNLVTNVHYNLDNDLVPMAYLGQIPMVLVTGKRSNIQSLSDIKNISPTQNLRYGSAGVGSTSHILGALLSAWFNRPLIHVPYKGGSQVIPDLLSGEIELNYSFATVIKSHLDTGKLIALATTAKQRLPDLAAVPTLNELGMQSAWVSNWYVILSNATADRQRLATIQQSLLRLTQDSVKSAAFARDTSLVLEPKEILNAKSHILLEIQNYRRLAKQIEFNP